MSAADLEELRRLAAQYAIPLDCVDRLGLRPREAARLLGVGERTIRTLVDLGDLPASKVGAAVVIPVVGLLRFLEDHPHSRPKRAQSIAGQAEDFIDGAS